MFLAWTGAILVGLSLGLLGSGGSILTVPVLVYLVGEPDKVAIAESLGIVGLISLAGFVPFAFNKQVHWRSVMLFGIPGMAGTYGGAYLSNFVSGTSQIILFAFIMILAAAMMFKDGSTPSQERTENPSHAWWEITIEGLAVGILTGLVGVGGGFLIVPALVLLGGLSIHLAVGTSLAIITLKSFSGFVKYLDVMANLQLTIDWYLIAVFGVLGALGSFAGRYIGQRINNLRLKKGFAVFLIIMGGYMIMMNL